jgi:hypothetical protein
MADVCMADVCMADVCMADVYIADDCYADINMNISIFILISAYRKLTKMK